MIWSFQVYSDSISRLVYIAHRTKKLQQLINLEELQKTADDLLEKEEGSNRMKHLNKIKTDASQIVNGWGLEEGGLTHILNYSKVDMKNASGCSLKQEPEERLLRHNSQDVASFLDSSYVMFSVVRNQLVRINSWLQ